MISSGASVTGACESSSVSPAETVEKPTRVVICGHAGALGDERGLEVVRAATPEELLAALAQAQVECAVLPLAAAGGPDGLRALRRESPSTAFVVLAEDSEDVRAAIRAGAHRCLPAHDVTGPMLRVAMTEAMERCAAGPASASAE